MTSVVRSDGEMHATAQTWRAAMLEKGWHSEAAGPEPAAPSEPTASERSRRSTMPQSRP
jgi:hypothetical protein